MGSASPEEGYLCGQNVIEVIEELFSSTVT